MSMTLFDLKNAWARLRPGSGEANLPLLEENNRLCRALDQARPLIVRYLTYEGVRQLLEQLRGKAQVEVFLNPAKPAAQPTAQPAPAQPAPVSPAAPPVGTVAS